MYERPCIVDDSKNSLKISIFTSVARRQCNKWNHKKKSHSWSLLSVPYFQTPICIFEVTGWLPRRHWCKETKQRSPRKHWRRIEICFVADFFGAWLQRLQSTCVSVFVEILHSLQCKIFKYTFLGQYTMKCWDFFSLSKIQQPAWLQLDHRKLGPSEMRLFWPLYHKTEKHSFKCDLLLWKTVIRVFIEF